MASARVRFAAYLSGGILRSRVRGTRGIRARLRRSASVAKRYKRSVMRVLRHNFSRVSPLNAA